MNSFAFDDMSEHQKRGQSSYHSKFVENKLHLSTGK